MKYKIELIFWVIFYIYGVYFDNCFLVYVFCLFYIYLFNDCFFLILGSCCILFEKLLGRVIEDYIKNCFECFFKYYLDEFLKCMGILIILK